MPSAREAPGVIAQLAGVQHRSRRSPAPSPRFPGHHHDDENTTDTFQPENESTQQFDTAADGHFAAANGPDSSDVYDSDDDHSISVEVGRGGRRDRHAYVNDYSEEQLLDLGDDSLYDITSPAHARVPQPYKSEDLRKQASVRRATMYPDTDITKISDIVPSKTRQSKSTSRRTLSDMHAKVNAISDSSYILPNENPVRQSRFSKPRTTSVNNEIPTRFTAGTGLNRTSGRTPRRAASAPDTSITGNQTAHSFMLPDLPNIAELVSGVRKDGTPVFSSKTAKSKSRFTAATYARGNSLDPTSHIQVQSLPLPEEEKAIFTSLQLLQERVAELETEKSEAVQKAEELEDEIVALKSQVQMERRLRRPDGKLGSEEEQRAFMEWRTERGQLQAALKTAQDRLERSSRKHSVADVSVKRISQERDSLITQLGVAFYSNEELKEENAQLLDQAKTLKEHKTGLQDEVAYLQEANVELTVQLAESEKRHDSDLRQWALREAELMSRRKRHSMPVEDPSDKRAAKHDTRRQSAGQDKQDAQSRILERVEQEVRKARAEAVRQSKTTSKSGRSEAARSKSRSQSQPRDTTTRRSALRNISANANRDRWLDEQADLEHEAEKTRADIDAVSAITDDSKDITYLSFLDPAELSALRRKLEAERLASKQRQDKTGSQTVQHKSSMKDIAGDFDLTKKTSADTAPRAVRVQSPATADAISYSNPDDAGDISVMSSGSRRPQRTKSFEEMTSAFFLPDVTMHKPMKTKAQSEQADVGAGPTTGAPKPIPVSERDIDTTFATERPAQDPQDALASVVSQLQDEVKELKQELGKTEKDYERCDPAVGKSKRIALKTRMEALVKEVEKRSEQVYALFDVLEGQKGNNPFEEVEETLQSIGVDLKEMQKRARFGSMKADDRENEVGDISAVSF